MNDLITHKPGGPGPDTGVYGVEEKAESKTLGEKKPPPSEDLSGVPDLKKTFDTGRYRPVLDVPKQDSESLALLLMRLRRDTGEVQQATSKEEILENMEKNRAMNKDKLAKLQDCMKKMEEANQSAETKRIWGWIAGGVGLVAALGGAVISTGLALAAWFTLATGFGAVAAIGLSTVSLGAWVGVAAAAASLVQSGMDQFGGTEALCNQMGWKVEDFNQVMNGIIMGFMIASAVMQIGGVLLSGGAGLAAGAVGLYTGGTSAAAQAGATAASIAKEAISAALQAIKKTTTVAPLLIKIITGFVSGSLQATSGAAKITQNVFQIDEVIKRAQAEGSRSDALDFEAIMKKLQGAMEDEMDRLKELIEQLEEGVSKVMDIFKTGDESKTQIIKQMI